MKKSLLLIGLMVGWIQISNAQILTIVNEQTGEPLQDVSLMSNHPNYIEMTNAEGQIDLSNFTESTAIQIFLFGYKKEVKSYADLASGNLTLQLIPFEFSGDAIIVSASKWGQNSENISSRTAYMDQRVLTLQNPQTTADLLGNSGEIFIQKSQLGGGSPMIRGFSTNRLLYTVDGVRMNNAIFRGGNIQNVISLDAFAIERTEIVFGPGSVMYGSDAIGAVMSFQTLKPEFSYTAKPSIFGSATTRYASATNEKTMHFDVNIGFQKWAFLTSFSSNEFGDLKMGSFGPSEYLRPFYVQRIDSTDVVVTNEDPRIQNPTGYSQFNLMQKIRFKPSKNWIFEYGFHYSETSSYSRYDRHIRYKNGLPRYGEWSYGPQKWMMNNLSMANTRSTPLYDQLTVRLAQQSFEESRISRDFNKPNRETRVETVYAYSLNIDLYKSIGKRNTISYGIETVLNDVISRGIDENISTGIATNGASRYPQATWASYGAYLANQFEQSNHFIVNTGVRYNQFTVDAVFDPTFYDLPFTEASLNNGALTGNLGLVYKPTEKWVINTNLATAFRSPNVDDMGKIFDSEPGSVVVPNPNLEAEYAYSGELGVSKYFGDYLKVDLTGYYTYLNNALVRRNFTLNGADSIEYAGELSQVQAIQNAATATVFGIQTGFSLSLKSGFGLSSRFNYQKGEEELDNGMVSPSRHAAPWFGITRMTYTYKDLRFELNCQYSGEKSFIQLPAEEQSKDYIYAIDGDGNPYSPAWYTINLKAAYKINSFLLLSAGVENLTDQRYRSYSSGIVAPGRNLIFSLKASF